MAFFDEPADMDGAARESWDAVRDGLRAGGTRCAVPALVASTLPELLADDSARELCAAGVPAAAGLRTGVRCARALSVAPADPDRLAPLALKVSAPGLNHKAQMGALRLGLGDPEAVSRAAAELAPFAGELLAEAMVVPGSEWLVSVTTDGLVDALIVGLGGAQAEVLDRVAIVCLPAPADRVRPAVAALGAPGSSPSSPPPSAKSLAPRISPCSSSTP